MTQDEMIAKLTEMLEIQQKLHETVIDMLKPAIEAEREACAKLCEEMGIEEYGTLAIAAAIRKRNQT